MAISAGTEDASAQSFGRRLAGIFALWPTDQASYPLGYLAALDGARGLTLGVMLAHTRMALFGGAMVYMDVFFVMSGYLITSLLLAGQRKHGKLSLRTFYIRRFLRLQPALTTMLACFVLACWLFAEDFEARLTEAAVSLFYLMDYWSAFGFPDVVYLGHTWSLAIEEQFYVLWPLTFVVLFRVFGLSWKIVAVLFAAAAGVALWRIYLTYSGAPVPRLYYAFDTRADALLAGCGLAIALKLVDLRTYPRLSQLLAWSLAPLAGFAIVLGFVMDYQWRWYYYVAPLFGTIPGFITTAALTQPRRTFMHAIYEHPVPVYCGRICYGLYIWHFPIFSWIYGRWPLYIVVFLVGWPLTFMAATASYFLIERRFMRARPL